LPIELRLVGGELLLLRLSKLTRHDLSLSELLWNLPVLLSRHNLNWLLHGERIWHGHAHLLLLHQSHLLSLHLHVHHHLLLLLLLVHVRH